MGSDKRTLATDALETLGAIIDAKAGRDAIHLAVEPVEAAMKLYPGQDVGLKDGKAAPMPIGSNLGIVDPFLKAPVQPGERFWLVVYPRQITSLRHVWEHPSFPLSTSVLPIDDDRKKRSEEWLRAWCNNTSDAPDYETLIAIAHGGSKMDSDYSGWSHEGDYLLSHGSDAYGDIPAELWDHVENVTGKKIGQRPSRFSCTC